VLRAIIISLRAVLCTRSHERFPKFGQSIFRKDALSVLLSHSIEDRLLISMLKDAGQPELVAVLHVEWDFRGNCQIFCWEGINFDLRRPEKIGVLVVWLRANVVVFIIPEHLQYSRLVRR